MEITEEHLANYPWSILLIHLTAGNEYAQLTTPKQKVMFPADLLEVWSKATINGQPLLEYAGDLVEAELVVVEKPWFTPQVCGILLLLVCVGGCIWVFMRKRKKND